MIIYKTKFFYHLPARIVEFVSEYMFLISKKNKQTSKTKKENIKTAKETKEEKKISPENRFEKINLRSPGSIFFSSPAFPETKGVFWPNVLSVLYFCFSRNFLILYWCKDCKNVIRDRKEISPKQTFLLVFRALQVPSWNIRFLSLELKSSISRNIKTFFF